MEESSRGGKGREVRSARARRPLGPPSYVEATYVLAVAGLATWGFAAGSTATILFAALVTLPAGLAALVGYYMIYGVLALVPGANPDSSSGSATCAPNGNCQGSTTGSVAAWLTVSTGIVGVLLLTTAAAATVILVRAVFSAVKER